MENILSGQGRLSNRIRKDLRKNHSDTTGLYAEEGQKIKGIVRK